jgi:hypothetical protein
MVAWRVYLAGQLIDTVFFMPCCTAEHVRRSLIDHNGFDPQIRVSR